jgi:hypothetical protein
VDYNSDLWLNSLERFYYVAVWPCKTLLITDLHIGHLVILFFSRSVMRQGRQNTWEHGRALGEIRLSSTFRQNLHDKLITSAVNVVEFVSPMSSGSGDDTHSPMSIAWDAIVLSCKKIYLRVLLQRCMDQYTLEVDERVERSWNWLLKRVHFIKTSITRRISNFDFNWHTLIWFHDYAEFSELLLHTNLLKTAWRGKPLPCPLPAF